MAAGDDDIGIFGRTARWLFGTRRQESLTEAEQGVQRLSVLTVWVPIALCALAAIVTLCAYATMTFVRLVSLGTAALAVGCFFGLLFGTPRVNDGLPSPDSQAGKATTVSSTLAANNNFYKIADWVTSAIVGIALVELKNFASFFWKALQRVIGADDVLQIAISAGLIIALFFAGFIWTFLNARVILMKAFATADQSAQDILQLRDSVAQLKQKTGEVVEQFDQLWASDPNKGKFGGTPSRNGRTLKVTKVEEDLHTHLLNVELTVAADGAENPLVSPVIFFLHPTVSAPLRTVEPISGVATCVVALLEAFTVGATCDDGATQLELDLETVADIPARFKAPA